MPSIVLISICVELVNTRKYIFYLLKVKKTYKMIKCSKHYKKFEIFEARNYKNKGNPMFSGVIHFNSKWKILIVIILVKLGLKLKLT